MASYEKRGDKWRVSVSKNGIRKTNSFKSKATARMWAAETEVELGSLGQGVSLTHTVNDVWDRYSREVSCTKEGARQERLLLMNWGATWIGSIKLMDLRREDLERWINERLKDVKPSTVSRNLTLISNTLTYARRWRLMEHNPMKDLKRPSEGTERERRVTRQEIDELLVALGYDDNLPVESITQKVAVTWLIALETAMRSGEILGVTAENLDLDKRVLFLPASTTKMKRARHIPLSSRAVELFKKFEPFGEGPIVGLKDTQRDVHFRKAMARTSIKDMVFHDSRHEATWRLSQKFEVLDLARVTGHRDLKMLLRYYNPTPEDLASKLD